MHSEDYATCPVGVLHIGDLLMYTLVCNFFEDGYIPVLSVYVCHGAMEYLCQWWLLGKSWYFSGHLATTSWSTNGHRVGSQFWKIPQRRHHKKYT